MSHDTNHGQPQENKTIISFKNSFWLVIIIVGLFVAALNFIQAESGEEGEGEHHAKTEQGATHEGHEATHEQKAEEPKPAEAAHTDSAPKAEH